MGWGPGLNKQDKKASQLPKGSGVIYLKRECITSTLLNQHNSFATANLVFIPADKCSFFLLIKETSLYSKWRPLQKTSRGYNAEMSRL